MTCGHSFTSLVIQNLLSSHFLCPLQRSVGPSRRGRLPFPSLSLGRRVTMRPHMAPAFCERGRAPSASTSAVWRFAVGPQCHGLGHWGDVLSPASQSPISHVRQDWPSSSIPSFCLRNQNSKSSACEKVKSPCCLDTAPGT